MPCYGNGRHVITTSTNVGQTEIPQKIYRVRTPGQIAQPHHSLDFACSPSPRGVEDTRFFGRLSELRGWSCGGISSSGYLFFGGHVPEGVEAYVPLWFSWSVSNKEGAYWQRLEG